MKSFRKETGVQGQTLSKQTEPSLRDRLPLVLAALNMAETIEDLRQPTFRLHPVKGNRKGRWAVTVCANWRLTFRFADGRAHDVDLENDD